MSAREINVLNELGLKQRETQSKLLSVALAKPENYYALRDDVEKKVLQSITENVYKLFKDLLSDGKVGEEQIIYKDANGTNQNFVPNLPFSDVQAFALDVAELIESKCEEAIEVILPRDKNQLAINKQRSLLKARTGFD
jgi:hypothetical protein